jgi:hypothetical protein
VQIVTALTLAVAMLPIGVDEALAALAAGFVCVPPNAYFAWATANATTVAAARRLLAQGAVRFGLTVGLMAGVIVVVAPRPLGFFVTLALMQGAYAMAPLLEKRVEQRL